MAEDVRVHAAGVEIGSLFGHVGRFFGPRGPLRSPWQVKRTKQQRRQQTGAYRRAGDQQEN